MTSRRAATGPLQTRQTSTPLRWPITTHRVGSATARAASDHASGRDAVGGKTGSTAGPAWATLAGVSVSATQAALAGPTTAQSVAHGVVVRRAGSGAANRSRQYAIPASRSRSVSPAS